MLMMDSGCESFLSRAGIFLGLHYTSDLNSAFSSLFFLIREIYYGWCLPNNSLAWKDLADCLLVNIVYLLLIHQFLILEHLSMALSIIFLFFFFHIFTLAILLFFHLLVAIRFDRCFLNSLNIVLLVSLGFLSFLKKFSFYDWITDLQRLVFELLSRSH